MSRRALLIALAVLIAAPDTARSQARPTPLEYSVKFVCGVRVRTDSNGMWGAVHLGAYHTAINIRNPGHDSVAFGMAIASTLPQPIQGPVSGGMQLRLGPGRALEVDCAELLRRQRFHKGFAVIQSPRELDVVAVYSAGGGAVVSTMDVERVAPRRNVCPDLTLGAPRRPTYDSQRHTFVTVAVANLGGQDATNVEVYAEDPAGTGPSRITTTTIPLVPAGQVVTVTLEFSYEISLANLPGIVVIVDPKNQIAECDETNNERRVGS